MEEKLRSPKFCAALVLSFFILVLIFFWDMSRAAYRVEAAEPRCPAAGVENDLSVQLSLARDVPHVLKILRAGDLSIAAQCKREVFGARLAADDKFLVSISLLIAAFFCFTGSLRKSRRAFWILLGLGILMGAAIGFSDWLENRQLKLWIAAASGPVAPLPDLADLKQFFDAKLTALAIAGGILGSLWKRRFGKGWRWLLWPLRATCLGSAVMLGFVVFNSSALVAQLAFGLVAAWWLLGALHCVAVAVSPEPAIVSIADRRDP